MIALALLGSTLVSLAVGEVTARLAGRQPLRAEPSHAFLWADDTVLGVRNRPSVRIDNADAESTIETGPFGERKGISWNLAPLTSTVVFVGDSTTLCAEVNDDETGPSQVALALRGARSVRVINAGVRGYSTVQSLRMMSEWLARSPVAIVVYTFCDNDFVEDVLPIYGIDVPLASLRGGELVFREPRVAPLAPGVSYRSSIRVGPVSRSIIALRRQSALFEAIFRPSRAALARLSGVPRADATAWKETVRRAEELGAHAILAQLVRDMDRRCREHGAKLLVTRFVTSRRPAEAKLWPPMPSERPVWETLARACQESGIACVDPAPAFVDDEESYCKRLRHGGFDGHYGAKGARTWAERVAPRVDGMLR